MGDTVPMEKPYTEALSLKASLSKNAANFSFNSKLVLGSSETQR